MPFPSNNTSHVRNGMTGIAVSLNKALEQSDQPGIGDLQYLQEVIHRRITGS